MSERVLFVDDEPSVLEAFRRVLRKHVDLQTATGGNDALRVLRDEGPFGLVVSDMRMPAMNGAQFFAKVREQQPDTVRMILSGQSDLQAAIAAVNEGHIYRFLSKPCPPEQLLAAVEEGLKQHRLIISERMLLEQTLSGAVKMLIEILGMVSPAAAGHAARLQRYAIELAKALGLAEKWKWGVAAFVSQIGCVALPTEIIFKVDGGQGLTNAEKQPYESHPEIAGKRLAAIPRLEGVGAIASAQFGPFDFAGMPADIRLWDVRRSGELLLRTCVEFDRLVTRGASRECAVHTLRAAQPTLPEAVLQALLNLSTIRQEIVIRQLQLKDLELGMILEEDLLSPQGIRLVPAGTEVTRTLIIHLDNIAASLGVAEPFRVRVMS
jgi:response regulator RpfG family c-di-GMP phosphodiesterase